MLRNYGGCPNEWRSPGKAPRGTLRIPQRVPRATGGQRHSMGASDPPKDAPGTPRPPQASPSHYQGSPKGSPHCWKCNNKNICFSMFFEAPTAPTEVPKELPGGSLGVPRQPRHSEGPPRDPQDPTDSQGSPSYIPGTLQRA